MTVPGRVLRSDNLQTLSDDDVRRLVRRSGCAGDRPAHHRRDPAGGRGPLRAVPEVTHRHFSLIPERGHHTDVFAVEEDELVDGLPADWVESLLPRQTAPRRGRAAGRARLPRIPRRPLAGGGRGGPALATSGPGASVVHCAAGKDRTGVVVALSLAVAGVGHDGIVADYAMTADVIHALVAKLGGLTDLRRGHGTTRRRQPPRAPRPWTGCDAARRAARGATGWLGPAGSAPTSRRRCRAAARLSLRDRVDRVSRACPGTSRCRPRAATARRSRRRRRRAPRRRRSCHRRRPSLQPERLGEALVDPVGQATDVVRPHQRGRMIANSSPLRRPTVSRADRGTQPRGDLAQQFVPGGVAERVVDLLEPVEIAEQQTPREPGPTAGERLLEAVEEQHAVGQTGQGVVRRLVADRRAAGPSAAPSRPGRRGPRPHEDVAGQRHRRAPRSCRPSRRP